MSSENTQPSVENEPVGDAANTKTNKVAKISETQNLTMVVKSFKEKLNIDDSTIKNILKDIVLPRNFPQEWGGKKKAAPLPGYPKCPSNAYIFYNVEMRPTVLENNPTLSNVEVISTLGSMWKKLDKEGEVYKKFTKMAAEDMQRYNREIEIFEQNNQGHTRVKTSVTKPTKTTYYNKFCEQVRPKVKEENPTLPGSEITKMLVSKWALIKDTPEANAYKKMAEEANATFQQRITDYHNSDAPKKMSKTEKLKANNPDIYELNPKTGLYVAKKIKAMPKVEEVKAKPKPVVVAVAKKKREVKVKAVVNASESKGAVQGEDSELFVDNGVEVSA